MKYPMSSPSTWNIMWMTHKGGTTHKGTYEWEFSAVIELKRNVWIEFKNWFAWVLARPGQSHLKNRITFTINNEALSKSQSWWECPNHSLVDERSVAEGVSKLLQRNSQQWLYLLRRRLEPINQIQTSPINTSPFELQSWTWRAPCQCLKPFMMPTLLALLW